jgi:hypothetical protein
MCCGGCANSGAPLSFAGRYAECRDRDRLPLEPFSASVINLSHQLPNWLVQGVFQVTAMVFILGMTVWIYMRHQRTPLEIISPELDRILVNYAVLPWKNRCASCSHRAHFQCGQCRRCFCTSHSRVGSNMQVTCTTCAT